MTKNNQTEQNFNNIEVFLKRVFLDPEERSEASSEIEEIVGLKIMEGILDQLPGEKHEEFMEIVISDSGEGKLSKYLKENNIELEQKILETSQELMHDIENPGSEVATETQIEGKPPVK